MQQHYWFLDILVDGMRLHTICKLAVAALVPALLVPGLVIARVSTPDHGFAQSIHTAARGGGSDLFGGSWHAVKCASFQKPQDGCRLTIH